jgi:hypothetical protein
MLTSPLQVALIPRIGHHRFVASRRQGLAPGRLLLGEYGLSLGTAGFAYLIDAHGVSLLRQSFVTVEQFPARLSCVLPQSPDIEDDEHGGTLRHLAALQESHKNTVFVFSAKCPVSNSVSIGDHSDV